MSKVAVVTDSNSGISQEEAKKLGIVVIPMPFMIQNENFFEDINLSVEDFYRHLQENTEVSTSQPSPADITDIWDMVLKKYDEMVYIPMSSGLSGSCQTALMLAGEEEYEGKVFVANNQRISVTMRRSVLDAIELAEKGYTAEKIKDILEENKFNSSIYIMLDTLYYLKKGGRITPAAAALGTILKLKPVLQIQGEKLDAFAKARTISQAKSIMTTAIKTDIDTRFGGDYHKLHIYVAHTQNYEAAEILKNELLEIFPDNQIEIARLPLSISCHIGPGALAIACSKQIEAE